MWDVYALEANMLNKLNGCMQAKPFQSNVRYLLQGYWATNKGYRGILLD